MKKRTNTLKKDSKAGVPVSDPTMALMKPEAGLAGRGDAEIARWVKAAVHAIYPRCTEQDLKFQAAAAMVASLVVGTRERRIAELLDYPVEIVSVWAKNLREGKIWNGNNVSDRWWFMPDTGRGLFVMDTHVALGHIERLVDAKSGEPSWYVPRPMTIAFN